jgi:predicted nucleic-acid-binding protein
LLGIDTNVLVRLLVQDDRAQSRRARELVQQAVDRERVVWVSLLVMIETEWVLRSRYAFSKAATLQLIVSLLETREFTFEDEPALEEALHHWKESPCGFADCLIIAHNRRAGCSATASFDRRAARLPGGQAA